MTAQEVISFPGSIAVIAVIFLALATFTALAAYVVQAVAKRFARPS